MIRKSLSLTSIAFAAMFAAACSAEAPKPSATPATKPADTKPVETKAAEPKATELTSVEPKPTEDRPADAPTPAAEVRIGTTPGDFLASFSTKTFQVVDGKTVEADYDHAKTPGVRVYVVNSTTCPYCEKYAERMTQIETAYAAKGVTFVYAYPDRRESEEAKEAWHTSKGHKGPWIVDKGGPVTKHLNGSKTPEYVVVNAAGIITYRGGIDDAGGRWKDAKEQYLTDALDSTLAGKAVAIPETTPSG